MRAFGGARIACLGEDEVDMLGIGAEIFRSEKTA